MMNQTALLLKPDMDWLQAFPRHAEMAGKWKHLASVFTLVLLCMLCPSEEGKKKFHDSLFFKDAASSAVLQVVFR